MPGPVESAQYRQRLATVATFLRSCVTQALSRGDERHNSTHASAYYDECNEDLIFLISPLILQPKSVNKTACCLVLIELKEQPWTQVVTVQVSVCVSKAVV